jgi:uncharacterized protein
VVVRNPESLCNSVLTELAAVVKAISTIPSDHIIELRLNIDHERILNENVNIHEAVKVNHWHGDAWCRLTNRLASFISLKP